MRELLKKYIVYLESKYPKGTIDFSLEKKLLDSIDIDEKKIDDEDNFSPGGNYEDFLSFCREKELKESSIKNYIHALRVFRKMLEMHFQLSIPFEVWHISSHETMASYIAYFESSFLLVELNLLWHHMISAAYNNYFKFLLSIESNKIKTLYINKHMIFYNIEKKIIGRKPTNANFLEKGSDNSLYLGTSNNSDLEGILLRIFNINSISEFKGKSFEMDAYGIRVKVTTNINDFLQVQITIGGNGTMYRILVEHQMKTFSIIDPINAVLIVDFSNNTLSIIEEKSVNE